MILFRWNIDWYDRLAFAFNLQVNFPKIELRIVKTCLRQEMLHLHGPDVIQFKTMTYIAARKWSTTGIFKLIQFQISISLTRQIWSAANTPLRKVATLLWNTFTIDVNKRRKSSLVLSVESAAFCEKSSPPLRIAVWFFFLCDCYLYEILGTAYRATVFRLVSLVFCLFSRTKSSKITENIFEMGIGSAKNLLESI